MLYLDVDNYEGTLEILKNLYNKMAKGGVIAFDEYALQGHGESDAVDEFLSNKKIKLKSFSWAKTPTAYIISVLLPGAPDRAFLNKFKQREQIYHLQL